MKPLRICLVSKEYPPEGKGGIATYTRLLAHGLAAAGNDVSVITAIRDQGSNRFSKRTVGRFPQENAAGSSFTDPQLPSSPVLGPVSLYKVPNHRLPLPKVLKQRPRGLWDELERSLAVDKAIARLERTVGRLDVVEMPNSGPEAFFYSFHPRAPLVMRLSTPMALTNHLKFRPSTRLGFRLHCLLEALTARRADSYIAHSSFNAASCASQYRLPVTDMRVIHLGTAAPPHLPTKRIGDDNSVGVLYVGRLQSRKGIHLLLQAILLVAEKMPHVKFIIAGLDSGDAPRLPGAPPHGSQGRTYQDYFANIATPSALKATTFLGYVEEESLVQLYADCDILVAPSLFESFGLMYAEAMAHAKPVVAFHTGAAPEVVVHNETGILVEPNDVTELANALIDLAKSRELRQDLGRRGYQRVCTDFSVQRMVDATEAHYRQVIAATSES